MNNYQWPKSKEYGQQAERFVMKKIIRVSLVAALATLSLTRLEAGDREWAVVGKVLTGVAAVTALSHAINADVYVAPPAYTYCPPQPQVVVTPPPVVYVPPPPRPRVIVRERPRVYRQRPVVVHAAPVVVPAPPVPVVRYRSAPRVRTTCVAPPIPRRYRR